MLLPDKGVVGTLVLAAPPRYAIGLGLADDSDVGISVTAALMPFVAKPGVGLLVEER
jgi:hypothetical protein